MEEVEIETFPHNVQLEVLRCNLTLYHLFVFRLRMWLWSVLGWLTFASFIAKAKAMSYFGIFKFSMLAPYKGYGNRGGRNEAWYYHRSSITTWQPHLLAQPWLSTPSLRLTPSDRVQSIGLRVRSELASYWPVLFLKRFSWTQENIRLLLRRE